MADPSPADSLRDVVYNIDNNRVLKERFFIVRRIINKINERIIAHQKSKMRVKFDEEKNTEYQESVSDILEDPENGVGGRLILTTRSNIFLDYLHCRSDKLEAVTAILTGDEETIDPEVLSLI